MDIQELLEDDVAKRRGALLGLGTAPATAQAAIAHGLSGRAAELAVQIAHADGEGEDTDDLLEAFARVTAALVVIDLPDAKTALLDASRHECALVRRQVALALVELRSEAACRLLESLVADPDEDVRNDAADAVRAKPWAEATRALLGALQRVRIPSEQTTRALAATAALASAETQGVVAAKLLAIARSATQHARPSDRHQCLRALDALVESGASFPGVAAAAAEFAESDDLRARLAGIALRAGAGHADQLAALLTLAATGSTDERAVAAVHLRRLPAPLVAAGILTALRALDPLVRARAASLAVGTIFLARESNLASLLALTDDHDERVREAAVMALSRCLPAGKPFFLDRKDAIAPVLRGLARDPSQKVTDAVSKAMKLLGMGEVP